MQVWTIVSGEDGDDRLRKALEPIDNGEQDIVDAAVSEFVHDPEPELGAFVLLEPEAEDLLGRRRP